MSLATTMNALADTIDPRLSYWSCLLTTNKRWSEHQLVPTLIHGQKGLRKLDWALDIVSTGDIKRVKEISLHCPVDPTTGQRQIVTLELTETNTAFQFKTKSLDMLGADSAGLEWQVIGRVMDKTTGECDCFVWDYRPLLGAHHLIAYRSNIHHFGCWRDNVCPIGALSLEVQGIRL